MQQQVQGVAATAGQRQHLISLVDLQHLHIQLISYSKCTHVGSQLKQLQLTTLL